MTSTKPPCTLQRQDCLMGVELGRRLQLGLDDDLSLPSKQCNHESIFEMNQDTPTGQIQSTRVQRISEFERLLTGYPPIFEALLLHLPTSAVFDLYHTSRSLRIFLRHYPSAWKNLSFRLLPPSPTFLGNFNISGFDSPDHNHESGRKRFALDLLLRTIQPFSPRLVTLDLDNSSITGTELHARVLEPRRSTLQHLSVRGCREVSLKYHILPYLQLHTTPDIFDEPFALKSIYTYRCRHHRRRPYLPTSLSRRDCDSQATHQLIELCHKESIWTDTAWCPTPACRCGRRQDYHIARHGAGPNEIWVPFDRLWRSQNYAGALDELHPHDVQTTKRPGVRRPLECLWESQEQGYAGEALGTGGSKSKEIKGLPMHLRESHRRFVEDFTCDECGDTISERCEQCSIRMHCMGCRKTLCASCAYDRPLRKKRRRNNIVNQATPTQWTDSYVNQPSMYTTPKRSDARARDPFWWAPGCSRSPNLMVESPVSDSSDDEENGTDDLVPPNLDMFWCCQKPTFSNSGGIIYNGPLCGDNLRAAPLARDQGFEDPTFPIKKQMQQDVNDHSNTSICQHQYSTSTCNRCDTQRTEPHINGRLDVLPFLDKPDDPSPSLSRRSMAPRNLCSSCYKSKKWRMLCSHCERPICIDHEVNTLRVRRCGYQELYVHWSWTQESAKITARGREVPKAVSIANLSVFFHKWRKILAQMELQDQIRREEGKWYPHIDDTSPSESENSQHNLATDDESQSNGDSTSKRLDSINLENLPNALVANQNQEGTVLRRCQSLPSLRERTSISLDESNRHRHIYSAPKWLGCGRYFCPSRVVCSCNESHLRQCQRCNTFICGDCHMASSKKCECTVCTQRDFMCPNCWLVDEGSSPCRRKEEEAAEKALEERVRKEWELTKQERDASDELAAGVNELFFAAMIAE